jgi:hypothetical protein
VATPSGSAPGCGTRPVCCPRSQMPSAVYMRFGGSAALQQRGRVIAQSAIVARRIPRRRSTSDQRGDWFARDGGEL